MTSENPVDLKKEFANFKEKLIEDVKNWQIENFEEEEFSKFIKVFFFPFLVKMTKFWTQTGDTDPAKVFYLLLNVFRLVCKIDDRKW
jgi:hypothetical protein